MRNIKSKTGGCEASVLSVAAGLKMAEVAMLMPPISNGICQPPSSQVDCDDEVFKMMTIEKEIYHLTGNINCHHRI